MPAPSRLLRRAVTVVGLAALGTAPLVGWADAATTTVYVGGAGCSDSGPGSSAQPFCTIGKAASVATAGQTVLIASGTYPGGISVAASGAPGSPITFAAAPGATVTITGGQNGISISGRHDVVVRDLAVTGTTSYGVYVSGSSAITLSGLTVTYAGHPVQGQIAAGIVLKNTTGSTVTGSSADHNSDSGILLSSGTTGTTVSHNEASWNAEGYQRNANGIDVISSGNTILGNVLHDNEDSGIQFYPGGNNNLATLNVSYNNGDHGIDDLNVTGGRIIGNTVFHNCTTGINVEGTSGSYVIENNVAVDNAVYPAYKGIACSRRAGNIGVWDSAPPTTVVDNNVVWLSKAGTLEVFKSAYTSLAALRAATGQELHGVQADPRFVAAGSGDLRLQPGSPAVDMADSGAPGEQANDLLGQPRVDDPGTPNTGRGPRAYDDAGAYELATSSPTPPPPPPPPPPSPSPQAPTAALAVSPASGPAPLQVTADGSASTDPQGQALTYAFDFGDGTTVAAQAPATASHTYRSSGTFTVSLTVRDTGGLTATATQPVTVSAAGGGGGGGAGSVSFVGQVATNYSTSAHTSGYISVWRSTGVQAGDLVVVTAQLTGTAATGAVTGTDSAGNTYTLASAAADGAGNRLAVLAGVARTALKVGDRITLSFPAATSYRIVADEASGPTGLDGQAAAAGTGSAFSSGPVTTTSAPELVVGAVMTIGGTPSWGAGWTPETTYSVGSTSLGRAYRIPTATGSFTAAGTATGSGWLAVVATFS